LTDYLQTGNDRYIKSFVLYVLAVYRPDLASSCKQSWRRLYRQLANEFSLTESEANYEYTRFGQQDYVRVPWQLYLIQSCARLFPLTQFGAFAIQAKVTSIVDGITSVDGFRYAASGPYLSTRTYACVFEMFTEIKDYNLSRPLPGAVLRTYGSATKALGSRWWNATAYALMLAVAVFSLVVWLRAPDHSLGDLAPNFLAEAVIVMAVIASNRVRRRL
jgi:hypothetical protein